MKKVVLMRIMVAALLLGLSQLITACSYTSNNMSNSKNLIESEPENEVKVSDSDISIEKENFSGVSLYEEPASDDNSAYVTDSETLQGIVALSSEEKIIDYADFSVDEFLEAVENVYHMAHDNGYTYGNSQTSPPCEDGIISCDRLIARALWDLGMTDQPQGGMTLGNEVEYLTSHGFELVINQRNLQRGDIVMQDNGVSGPCNWRWHTFVLVSYDKDTTYCEKYDCGHFTPDGQDRISSEQPFFCPLADYKEQRRFVCGFHLKSREVEGQTVG